MKSSILLTQRRSVRLLALQCAATLLLAASTGAQEPVPLEIAAYFPEGESDSWLFSTPSAETGEESGEQRTLHASEALDDGRLRVDGSDGSLRVQQATARSGWAITEEAALGGRRLVFEEPLALLPARTETGASHEAEGRYQAILDEEIVQAGTVRATVAVGALTEIIVPAGTFDDCLQIEVLLEFSSDDEPESTTTVSRQLWRARGVGVVREISDASSLDLLLPQEERTDRGRTEWQLVEAAVSGTLVTAAEDPRPQIDLGRFEPPPR